MGEVQNKGLALSLIMLNHCRNFCLLNGPVKCFKFNATRNCLPHFRKTWRSYWSHQQTFVSTGVRTAILFAPCSELNLKGLKEGPPIKTDKGHEIAFQLTLVSNFLSQCSTIDVFQFHSLAISCDLPSPLQLRGRFSNGVGVIVPLIHTTQKSQTVT